MIKFVGEKDGKQLIGLGISRGNVSRLEKGKPILVKGEEMGFPDIEILIFFKETDEELAKSMEPFIKDNTKLSTFTEYRG